MLFSQEPVVTRISPVPLWPSDGNISDELKNYSVFFNPVANEVVVLLAASDGSTSVKPLTFQLHNGAIPSVTTMVSRGEDGMYVYQYTIGIAPESRRPLEQYSLLIPGLDSRLSAASAAPWEIATRETAMVDRLASKHVPLKYIDFKSRIGAELQPGYSQVQMRIVSAYAPGYVTAFARSKVEKQLPAGALAAAPKTVLDQIARITAPEFDGQMGLVVGPRFDRDTPMATVAASFDFAMQHFAVHGQLDTTSSFVKSCTAVLRAFTQGGGSGTPDLACAAEARTAREKELAEAMRMSLSETR